jgi:pimeloyl-ACP methyl ester carboxylesterase
MEINQQPIALKCLGEPMMVPAWKQKPSWFLVAEKDRMISPATQHFMAERIVARVHSCDTDHSPLVSAPESVVRVIVEAADAVVLRFDASSLASAEIEVGARVGQV